MCIGSELKSPIVKVSYMIKCEKILSPRVYAFQRNGNRSGNPGMDRPYHQAQTTVRKMFSNQVYCGDTVNFKQGEIDKYAGILYCGECGLRLYLHREKI